MPRARLISPKFFKSEQLSKLPHETRLLFIGLWALADSEGRLEDHPRKIQEEIFPRDAVDIENLLNQLDAASLIFRYRILGCDYIQIPKWRNYQRPHPKEPSSKIPRIPLSLYDFSACREFATASRKTYTQQPIVRKRKEQLGPLFEESGTSEVAPAAPAPRFGTWSMDESYAGFCELYRRSGALVSDEDFALAWHVWKLLDWEQKRDRAERFAAGMDAGEWSEPRFIPRPRNFLQSHWKRPLPTQSPSKHQQSKNEVERLFRERMEP